MVGVVAFIYIVSTIVYLAIGDSTILWGGVNHLTLLFAIAGFAYLPKPTTAIDKDFVNFAIGLTIARALYTILCMNAEVSWIYDKTNYFTIAITAIFIAFLIYSATAHKRFKKS